MIIRSIIVITIFLITVPAGIVTAGTALKSDAITSTKEIASTPKARFSEKKYKFGTVKKGKVISHDFELFNDGDGVLKIEELVPA